MSQNPDRQYDKTHLSIDLAEERGFIHRDYIAHCFRWSHVTKYLMAQAKYKRVLIMDVGCGKDFTLFAKADGVVKFEVKGPKNRKFVSIVPA